MRKIIESTFITLDGCIGEPHVWGQPYWDEQHASYNAKLVDGSDAMLLGRETYDGFKDAWTSRAGDPVADRMNALPKYVASRTLTGDLEWNARALEGDVAEAVAALKQQPGENLIKYGTGEFDRTLLEHKLVDEYHFWTYPVIAGGDGYRLGDGFDLTHLKLIDQTIFDSGIIVGVYAPK
ncbi:dihydrofolate reductase family protein [Jiangella alba]|uniref:Dihydrofolate reductase n=1 Tax=Jiangella alba TaxID=561176 RepID=A0A1H5PQ36_9ACTN|nr:dihydrofolate reductase family protein [Jiangella alba]SEF15819.1 Dihydrofolate reductase [Jiangella alba]